jgi:hypothetical protein
MTRKDGISKARTVDERVKDGHGAVGDASVRVDLLENWKRRVSFVLNSSREGELLPL